VTRLQPRLAARLLLFSLLLVFLPVAGLLSIDTLERRLTARQEESLAAQARLLAASLGESGELVEEEVRLRLRAASFPGADSPRFQVLDRHGRLLADSAALSAPAAPEAPQPPLAGADVQLALAGVEAGGRLPAQDGPSTLFRLAPVRSGEEIVAAVIASATTSPTRDDVGALRRAIWRVFAAALVAAVLLSAYFARSLARPLHELAHEAADLLDPRGQVRTSFTSTGRQDEIGDLARALEELARRLRAHLGQAESAAADLSHEIRNPLASIRGAAELLAEVDRPEDRRRFLATIEREVARLQLLLRAVRQSAALDAQLLSEERQPVDLASLLSDLALAAAARSGHAVVVEPAAPRNLAVMAVRERLQQVFDNLLDNALGFSPPGAAVEVTIAKRDETAIVSIRDRGPGVPPEHLERIFERFFSYRPEDSASTHTGLGLAIARSIARAYGGDLTMRNEPAGGALFEVALPLVRIGDVTLRTE
jgi:two-component system, OmpR family, sensor histidine kinase ChvG